MRSDYKILEDLYKAETSHIVLTKQQFDELKEYIESIRIRENRLRDSEMGNGIVVTVGRQRMYNTKRFGVVHIPHLKAEDNAPNLHNPEEIKIILEEIENFLPKDLKYLNQSDVAEFDNYVRGIENMITTERNRMRNELNDKIRHVPNFIRRIFNLKLI